MKILSITTSHRMCGCAVSNGERILGEIIFTGDRRCVEELTERIEGLLRDCKLRPEDLGGIAVDIGPGMFTGLKIGIVTAKTYAQVLNLPMVGISSFTILAEGVPSEYPCVATIIHSSRDEFYFALFRRTGVVLEGAEPGSVLTAHGIKNRLLSAQEKIYVTGGGAQILRQELPAERLILTEPQNCSPNAANLCRLAFRMFKAGQGVPYQDIVPLYIWLTNAERNLAKKDGRSETIEMKK